MPSTMRRMPTSDAVFIVGLEEQGPCRARAPRRRRAASRRLQVLQPLCSSFHSLLRDPRARLTRPTAAAHHTAPRMSRFPLYRPRRLRRTEALRRLVRETRPSVEHLVQPLFVVPGSGVERAVASMPGVAQLSVDRTAEECRRLADAGVPA